MPEVAKPVNTDSKPDRQKEADNDLVLSYLTLRNLIGVVGILLPVILIFFTIGDDKSPFIEPSISDYYYSRNGDLFVVLLSVLGVFLFTYKGYPKKKGLPWERVLTMAAALGALGVAFYPTAREIVRFGSIHGGNKKVPGIWDNEIHFLFAAAFFLSVAIICLQFFPRTDKDCMKKPDGKRTQKAKRNIVFRICGWTILTCVVLLAVYFKFFTDAPWLKNIPVIFILESVAVISFGIAWLTKGETLWPDGEHYVMKAVRDVKEAVKTDAKAIIQTESVALKKARNSELDKLQPFIGQWHAEGESYADGQDPADPKRSAVPWTSDESYIWLPGNHFVVHKWDAKTGDKPFMGTEIIGYDETKKQFFIHFFDNGGFHPTYDAVVQGNTWDFSEPNTRARVVIKDADTMTFHWEWKNNGSDWLPLCDREAKRIG